MTETVAGVYPQLELELRSERCNHCDNAPCVRCCPTGASYIAEGGIVLVEHNKCIGCGACIESCPYDARAFEPEPYVQPEVEQPVKKKIKSKPKKKVAEEEEGC